MLETKDIFERQDKNVTTFLVKMIQAQKYIIIRWDGMGIHNCLRMNVDF